MQAYEACQPTCGADAPLPDWLIVSMAVLQAMIAIFRADAVNARKYAKLALESMPPQSTFPWRAHLLVALSYIHQTDGNFEEARQNLVDAIEAGKLAGDIYMTLDATTHLVMMLCGLGNIRQASSFAQQGMRYVEQFGLSRSTEASMLFLAWGYLLCEQHKLEEAGEYIRQGLETCQQSAIPGMLGWAYQVQLRYLIAIKDWKAAEEFGRKSAQLMGEVEIPAGIANGLIVYRCDVWIRQGNLAAAKQTLSERGICLSAQVTPQQHAEFATLGKLLLAEGNLDAAEPLFRQLLQRAEAKSQRRMIITALIQLALLEQARGNWQQAVQTLDRALGAAEPEGYRQLFLDEAGMAPGTSSMENLLAGVISQAKHAAFARELLTLLPGSRGNIEPDRAETTVKIQTEYATEIPALSRREIEVLQKLEEGLSNKEIAKSLYISLRTVKYHTTNIFTKLKVDNRTQAVLKAKAVGILKD